MRVLLRAAVGFFLVMGFLGFRGAWGANWTNAGGDARWGNAANWDSGVPNAVDAIANFTLDITSDTTITLDGDKTVGTLIFNDSVSSSNWILNSGTPATSKLTLDVTTGSAVLNVANNSAIPTSGAGLVPLTATLNTVVAGNDGLTKTGPGTLVLTAANTYTGLTNVRFGGLTLDFSAAGAPASNIIVGSNSLLLGGDITVGGASGGVLNLIGAGGATNSQSFAGTTFSFGNNVVQVNQNGATAVNLSLGTVARTTGAVVKFTLPTAGNLSATNIPNVNGIIGGWATIGVNDTATWASNDGAGNIVGYSAFTNVTGDTPAIVSGATTNVRLAGITAAPAPATTTNVAFTAGTTDLNSVLDADIIALTLNVPSASILRMGNGGIFKSSTANVALTVGATGSTLTAGGATANTGGELFLTANAPTGDLNGIVVASAITNNGTGVVSLVKAGTGAVQVNVANSYTGGTYINSGRLRVSGSATLGTGSIYVASGGQLYFDRAATFANPIFLSGKGFFESGSSFSGGALRTATAGTILSGRITLLNDARITARGTAATGATISGQITGGFGLELGNTAGTIGTLILSNATNNWSGDTTIGSGTVRIGGTGEVIPNGAAAGNVILLGDISVANTSVLDLNGKTETINGLSSSGNLSRVFVNSGIAGAATLRVGDNNANATFGGTIQDGNPAAIFNLTKIGTGVQRLSGTGTYSGSTTIENGTLGLASSSALPTGAKVTLGAGATSGALDLGGFDATVSVLQTAGTGAANVVGNSSTSNNSTLTFAGAANTFAGRIQDTLSGGTMRTGLTVNSGTLTLSGANTYTGDTNIVGGTLAVTGSLAASGNLTVNGGGVLAGTGDGITTGRVGNVILSSGAIHPGATGVDTVIGALRLNTLSANSGDLRYDISTPASLDQVTVTGNADFSSGATISLSSPPAPNTYTLLTAGSLTGSSPTLNVPPAGTTRATFALNFDTVAKRIQLTVTGSAKALNWTGVNGTPWDVNNTVNWTDGAIAEKFFNLDSVNFLTGPTNRNVTLDQTITPGAVVVNNALGNDYTITGNGSIADNGFLGGTTLTKLGAGTLTLGTVNTYAGATAVQDGMLKVGAAGALPVGTQLILGSGTTSGIVDLNDFDTTVGGLSTAGTGAANIIGNNGSSQVTLRVTAATGAFNGSIRDSLSSPAGTGSVALTISGGTLTLGGDNTYTGQTTVMAGTKLQIGAGGATGSIGATSISLDGTLVFNRTGTLMIASSINGSGSIQQIGTGTTILAADNFYSGLTTISAGVLQVGNGGTTGQIGGGGPITDSALLAFNRSDDISPTSVISGIGAVDVRGTGTVTFNTAQTYSGGLSVTSGTARLTVVGAGGTGASTVKTGGTLVLVNAPAPAAAISFTNPITLSGGTLGGSPNLTAFTTGAVTATAGTTSTVYTSDPQNLTVQSEMVATGALGGSGNINVLAGTNQPSADGGVGFRLRGTGASTYSGRITLGSNVKGELQTGVVGPFSPGGTGTIILTGGTYTLNTNQGTYSELNLRNNFSGAATTLGNNIELAGTGLATLNPLGSAPANNITNMGNLKIGDKQELGVNTNATVPFVVAFPTVTLTGGIAGFSPKTPNFNFSGVGNLNLGVIGESVAASGIDMKGLGLLTVTGAATYTGPTAVDGGTLRVTGSIASSSGVTVNNAAAIFEAPVAQRVKALTVTTGLARVVSTTAKIALTVGDGTAATAPLSVTGGKVDLLNNGIAVDYAAGAGNDAAALASVRAQIVAGYNPTTPTAGDGTWNGATGINSSSIGTLNAIGYALASDVLPFANGTTDSFLGTTVDKSTVIARFTLSGDVNLDGAVDFLDLAKLAQSYNVTDGTRQWSTGDVNYDGNTDFLDLAKLAQNYNTALPSSPVPGASADFQADLARAFAAVPEPGALSLLLVGGISLLGRRRRGMAA
jgi:fibronectin-binding autotransporter adhesin